MTFSHSLQFEYRQMADVDLSCGGKRTKNETGLAPQNNDIPETNGIPDPQSVVQAELRRSRRPDA
jgi:hypothetical protein